MNELNSIIIEGTVMGDPTLNVGKDHRPVGYFRMYSMRKEHEEPIKTEVNVTTYGPLATTCNQYLKEGRRIRVVGRIRQASDSNQLQIVGEHVEFKASPNIEEIPVSSKEPA